MEYLLELISNFGFFFQNKFPFEYYMRYAYLLTIIIIIIIFKLSFSTEKQLKLLKDKPEFSFYEKKLKKWNNLTHLFFYPIVTIPLIEGIYICEKYNLPQMRYANNIVPRPILKYGFYASCILAVIPIIMNIYLLYRVHKDCNDDL